MENTTGTGASAPVSTPSAAPAAAPSATSGAASTPTSTQPSPSAGTPDAGSGSPSSEVPENVSTTEYLASKLRDGFGIDKDGNPKPETDTANDLSSDDGSIDDSAAATGEEGQAGDGTQDGTGENAFDFDSIGFTGAKELNDQIAADPALKSALDANPELKSRFFANARLAERANKYDEIVGSPDEAQVMSQGYTAFSNLGEHMAAIEEGNFQSMTPFMESLKEQTALRDENGEIRRYPDGSMMTDGSVGKFLKTFFHERLEILMKKAQSEGNENLQAALDEVMESAELRGPSSARNEDEPEELQEQRASLEQERKALDERKQAQFKADLDASDARVDSKTDTVLEGALKSILDAASGLDQFSRTTLENNIRKELSQFIRGSVSYRNQRAAIERMPLGPAREARVVQLNTRFVNENLRKIATKAIASAGVSLQTKTQQRQDRQAARVEASKSDTNSAMSHVAPGSSAAEHASIPKIEADLRAKLGREASTQEVLAERMMRMRTATATR